MTTHKALIVLLVTLLVIAGAFVLFTTVFCEDDWCDLFGRLDTAPTANNSTNTVANTQATVNTQGTNIYVSYPAPDQTVSSPLVVSGQARGTWFFEGVFSVRLVDGNGSTVAYGPAQAGGEWMTEEFVAFSASLVFAPPQTDTGRLILTQDDPSGIGSPETYSIPVTFASSTNTNN